MNFLLLAVQTFGSVVAAGTLALVTLLSGCASGSVSIDSNESASGSSETRRCTMSENLLVDTDFTRQGQFALAWRAVQHTGERSFSVEVTDGTLEIRRIASQPWMLFRQTVDDARLPGATIRYTAELRGDLPSKPRLHGFDHVGGLYLKIGRDRAMLAKHEPNANQWDWQPFSYEAQVPLGVNSLQVGFVHQSGGGLWARDPSLVILACD